MLVGREGKRRDPTAIQRDLSSRPGCFGWSDDVGIGKKVDVSRRSVGDGPWQPEVGGAEDARATPELPWTRVGGARTFRPSLPYLIGRVGFEYSTVL